MYKRLQTFIVLSLILKLIIGLSLAPLIHAQDGSVGSVDLLGENADIPLPNPGTTPDSPFYGLELAIEKIQLALTFGKAAKAERGLVFAEERLAEVKAMVEANKIEAAARAKKEHSRILAEVELETEEIGEDETAIQNKIKIKKKIIKNHISADNLADILEVRIRARFIGSELTPEQVERLHSFIDRFAQENSNITEADYDEGEEEDEGEGNLTSFKMEAAGRQIEAATEELAEAKEILAALEGTSDGNNDGNQTNQTAMKFPGINAVERLIEEATEKLTNAESAFEEEKYGRAFGQATAAKRLALAAQRILERLEDLEERRDGFVEELGERVRNRIRETQGHSGENDEDDNDNEDEGEGEESEDRNNGTRQGRGRNSETE